MIALRRVLRRPLVMAFLLLCVGSALALWLQRHQPIASFALPDGTELRVEYVTYGREHHVPKHGALYAWVSRLAQRWPSLRVPFYEKDYGYSSEEPQLGVCLTHFDPRTGQFLPSVDAALQMLPAFDASGQQVIRALRSSSAGGQNAPPMPHAMFEVSVYDRRKATVPLCVTMQGKTFDMEIPNPAAKLAFPQWRPEPLPQKRTLGDGVEMVLKSLSLDYEYGRKLRVRPEVEFFRDGQKVLGIAVSSAWFVDATGNHDVARPPMFSEAWKIHVTVKRDEYFPFAEKVDPVGMPGVSEYRWLQPPRFGTVPSFSVLVGPGWYVIRDGVVVERGQPLPNAGVHAFLAATAAQSMRIHVDRPALIHLVDPDRPSLFDDARLRNRTVLLQWNGGSASLWPVNARDRFSGNGSGTPMFPQVYQLLGNGEWRQKLPLPGTPMTVQVQAPLAPGEETMQFTVAPPILSSLLKKE